MFLALLRKNFWLWRPGRSANVPIMALAFLVSVLDMSWPFPAPAWLLIGFLAFLIGQSGGGDAMGVDFKHQSIRFLEYLPIRRWTIWLANWLDQMAACLIVIALLFWHRIVAWTPPLASGPYAPLDAALFGSRWLLPLVLCSIMVASFGHSLFWRTFFRSELASLIPGWISTAVLGFAPAAVLIGLQLVPPWHDSTLILLLIGLAFSLASLLAFALPPVHWGRAARFGAVGLPLFVSILIGEVAGIYAGLSSWKQLDASDRTLIVRASFEQGDPNTVLLDVRSSMSGQHALLCDLANGTVRYLGRGLSRLRADWDDDDRIARAGAGGPLVFISSLASNNLWPAPPSLITLDPEHAQRRSIVPIRAFVDTDGSTWQIIRAQWTADGRWLVAMANPSEDYRSDRRPRRDTFTSTRLLIGKVNSTGVPAFDVRRRLSVFGSAYLLSDGGRIVAQPLPKSPADDDPADPSAALSSSQPAPAPITHRYRIYDIASERDRYIELPGAVIRFAADLSQALCLRVSTRDGMCYRSVVRVDLDTLDERTIIAESELAPLPGMAGPLSGYYDLLPARQGRFDQELPGRDPMLDVDPSWHHLVWLRQRIDTNARRISLVDIDLSTLQRTELVAEADLAPVALVPSYDPRSSSRFWGFSSDGSAVLLKNGRNCYRVSIPDGTRQTTTLGDDALSEMRFSPSGVRLALIRSAGADTVRVVVLNAQQSRVVYTTSEYPMVRWLDENWLLVTDGPRLLRIAADGSSQSVLFPPP